MENKDLIARFVVRPNENGKDDGLILGCSFKTGRLKPGVVYEIVDLFGLGQIMIREVGDSSCKFKNRDRGVCWCNDANQIIDSGNHLLTDEEYDDMCVNELPRH